MQDTQTPFFVDNEVIMLTKNGVWMADGSEITHEPTRKLFARSLKHDPDGYRLYIGRETKLIQVEDTAYFIHRIDGDPVSGYDLWISDETRERLMAETLSYRPGRLVCRVKREARAADGAKPPEYEEAKFISPAYFDLLRHLEEDKDSYFLTLEGRRVPLAGKP